MVSRVGIKRCAPHCVPSTPLNGERMLAAIDNEAIFVSRRGSRLTTLWIVLRALHFLALILLVGSAFYTALLAPVRLRPWLAQRLRPLLLSCSAISVASAVAMALVQTALMSGDWRSIGDVSVWQAVRSTRFGLAWQWEIGFSLLGLWVWRLRGLPRQQGLLVAGLLQLMPLAWIGHAAMHDGLLGIFHQMNQTLHLVSVSFWAGGLLPLLLLMRDARHMEKRIDAIRAMMRFSRYGHLAVAMALCTGTIDTMLIVGPPFLWTFNSYIALLLLKILLVSLMVSIAVYNRYYLVPQFHEAGSRSPQLFLRLTQYELLLSLGVVGLVSVFATLTPT